MPNVVLYIFCVEDIYIYMIISDCCCHIILFYFPITASLLSLFLLHYMKSSVSILNDLAMRRTSHQLGPAGVPVLSRTPDMLGCILPVFKQPTKRSGSEDPVEYAWFIRYSPWGLVFPMGDVPWIKCFGVSGVLS